MVAHGLITGMLFFLAGSIQERYGTREMSRLGGLLTQAPHLGWLLGFSAMASLGLPGLAGFWGEFPSILSAYDPKLPFGLWGGLDGTLTTFRIYMVIAAIGTVLAAGYLLWMFQRVAFGPLSEFLRGLGRHLSDLSGIEVLTLAPLAALTLIFGLFPGLVLDLIQGPVDSIIAGLAAGDPVAFIPWR
jgi:NADH-quinone oxidoreductase subunit M